MKKTLLVISVIFIVVAALMLLATLSAHEWSFQKLMNPTVIKTIDIDESFEDISVYVDTADVKLVPTDEKSVRVERRETYKLTNTVEVKDGVLKIESKDNRRWYEHVSISPTHFEVTIYLPKGEWGALKIDTDTGNSYVSNDFTFKSVDIRQSTGKICISADAKDNINLRTSTGNIDASGITAKAVNIKASTGNISVSDVTFDSLKLETSTGNISLSDATVNENIAVDSSTGKQNFANIACKNLSAEADTGDAVLTNVIVSGRLDIERSTGGVKLDSSDASEISIETDTGNVTGTLLSDKVFIVRTDTGDIDVPKSTVGGRCEIETDTGNVIISVK